jgi:hypothetical protein
MRWCTEDIRNADNILFGKPAGKRPLGRPNHRREDNIKMGLKNRVGWCELETSGSG